MILCLSANRLFTALQLSGLNLQVAEAARRSGFNTRNHVALMDLIWSVRRVTFGHGLQKPREAPPPKHPIYPDKYRPGSKTDNTKKPGKRARELEFHQPRKLVPVLGTSKNPIELDTECSEIKNETDLHTSNKRRKIHAGQSVRSAKAMVRGARDPVHPDRLSNLRLADVGKENIPPPPTTQASLRRSQTVFAPSPSARALLPFQLLQTPTRNQKTLTELDTVSQTLKENISAVTKCQQAMKVLYDVDEDIRNERIFPELMKLRDAMHACETGAAQGINHLSEIADFLTKLRDGFDGIE